MARSALPIHPRARGLSLLAATASLAVGLSACSSGGSSGGSSGSSADTISVGVPVADIASLVHAGVAAPDALSVSDIETMYKAALGTVSGTAAAGGHKLAPDFATFDLVQPGAPQTACLHFVRDQRDDVVLSTQFVNGGDQCVVQRGGVLLQNVAAPQAAYDASGGAVYTMDMVPAVAASTFASSLVKQGNLKGQKVGVLTDALGGDAAPVTGVLIPALKKAGINVVHVTTLSADLTQVAQQVPVEVSQMKDAGVTTIVDATPSPNLAQFLGGMKKVGWQVPFIASDLNAATAETFAAAYGPSFQGTAITAQRFGDTDSKAAQACYSTYQKAGGRQLQPGTVNYNTNLEICDSVTLLAAGLKQLGSTGYSKAAFTKAMSKVGDLDFAFYGPSGLSGKAQSTVKAVRDVTWSAGGWKPAGGGWTSVSNG